MSFLNFIQKPEKKIWKPLNLQENVILESYTKAREFFFLGFEEKPKFHESEKKKSLFFL